MAIQKLSAAQGAGSAVPTAGRFAQCSGGTVTTYSSGGVTYEVHTFTASGTLTVASSGVVDVLVVGGGGGSGSSNGYNSNKAGGGGAGGFLYATSAYLPGGSYSVVVGNGGNAGATDVTGSVGGYSSVGPFVAYGGGGGAGTGSSIIPTFGASGGGGQSGTTSGAITMCAAQGYAGGNANGTTNGGGGGGSGGAGGSPTAGVGTSNSITGSAVTYAAGGPANSATAGAANTGNGGGVAASNNATGTAGGSGIVIVRTVISGSAAGVAASGGTETTFTGNGTIGVNGQGYKVHSYTTAGSGSFTVTAGGWVDFVMCGGGGGGSHFTYGGAGGGGGEYMAGSLYLNPGTYTLTIGAAGAVPTEPRMRNTTGAGAGGTTILTGGGLELHAIGGGAGGGYAGEAWNGGVGASAGGVGINDANQVPKSFTGYGPTNTTTQGGGGAGGAGSAYTGGVGITSYITGSAVEYCGGGNGRANDDTPANNVPTPAGKPGRGGNAMDDPGPGYAGNPGAIIFRYPI